MSDIRPNVERVLRAGLANDDLARELDMVSKDPDFASCADLWAPELYNRDPRFFAPFLTRNLTSAQADVIAALLPRIEADGQEDLFTALYKVTVSEAAWNNELGELAASEQSDAEVRRAVEWRADVPSQFALNEDVAAALYRRIPGTFARLLLAHVQRGYDWQLERQRTYHELRQSALAQHDDAVYWQLFRAFATPDEWKVEMSRLAQQNLPAEQIVAALEQRRLDEVLNMDPAALVIFIDNYGAALTPFIDANLDWFGRLQTDMLLDAIERGGDQALFRRVFFRFADATAWNRRVRSLVQSTSDNAALATALQRWQPPTNQIARRTWPLDPDLALTLYQRDAGLFRDFILQTLNNPDIRLFDEVEDTGDQEMLDALTFAFLDQLATLISTSFPYAEEVSIRDLSDAQRGWAMNWAQAVNERFDTLFAQSPTTYTRHAANILSRGIGAAWKLRDDDEANPVAYLYHQHRAAWLASRALRDLLETPDGPTFEFALDLLSVGGPAAADRVAEAVPVFTGFLLSTAGAPKKRRVLRILEAAAAQSAQAAAVLAPMLREMMAFHNEQNLDERLMVSFVRARHYAAAQSA